MKDRYIYITVIGIMAITLLGLSILMHSGIVEEEKLKESIDKMSCSELLDRIDQVRKENGGLYTTQTWILRECYKT